MILRSLELRHFGKFSEKSVDFRRGLNLVIGPNEAGKSTLIEAIPAALFGMRDKERFRPWGKQGAPGVALSLEGRSHTVRIERDLTSDRVVLAERDDLYHNLYRFEGKASPQGRSSEREEYLEQLSRLFGIADEDIFRASLYFGQGSLEVSGQGGMAAKIKTLLSGFVEVDYDKVLQSLQEDYFSLTRENPWGRDKNRDRELEEVRQRQQELQEKWTREQDGVEKLEAMRAEIAELKDGIDAGRSDYEKGERYLSWVRQQHDLEEKAERLRKDLARFEQQHDKVSDLLEKRDNIEKEFAAVGLPRQIPEKLPRLLEESEEVRQELVRVQSETVSLRDRLVRMPAPRWKWRAGATAGLLGAVVGGYFYLPQWFPPIAVIALVAAVCIWAPFLSRLLRFRSAMSNLKGQGKILEQSRVEAQQRLAEIDGQFETMGIRSSAVERVKMQRNLVRHRELIDTLREVESALRVLETPDALQDEKQSAEQELAEVEESLEKERPKYGQSLMAREDLPDAENKLRQLGEELQHKEKRLLELTRSEAAMQGALADLEHLQEELEQLQEREKSLAFRAQALKLGFDLLNDAVTEFRQTYLQNFAADIGHYLSRTTAGRYAEARLDDDFNLFVKTRSGQWQPVESFSRGTADAVYFSVRLALTRHLSRGRNLPFLLDDPLVNLDAARLSEALDTLEKISAEHQVILLSHDERLLKRAARDRWHVVTLDKIKAAQVNESPEKKEELQQLFLL